MKQYRVYFNIYFYKKCGCYADYTFNTILNAESDLDAKKQVKDVWKPLITETYQPYIDEAVNSATNDFGRDRLKNLYIKYNLEEIKES